MGVLPDWMIERDVKIEPFAKQEKREGVISYGVTSYGYDARIGYKFRVFSPIQCSVVDPKNFDEKALVDVDLSPEKWGGGNCERPDHILIPPHGFVLGETVETFEIPRDCLAIVVGKSTYARCGIIVNVTPLEPEWCGKVTVEISNTSDLPAKIYCGEGIMQVIFLRSDGVRDAKDNAILNLLINKCSIPWSEDHNNDLDLLLKKGTCTTSYADKKGKYQNQEGLTLPTVDKKEESK